MHPSTSILMLCCIIYQEGRYLHCIYKMHCIINQGGNKEFRWYCIIYLEEIDNMPGSPYYYLYTGHTQSVDQH